MAAKHTSKVFWAVFAMLGMACAFVASIYGAWQGLLPSILVWWGCWLLLKIKTLKLKAIYAFLPLALMALLLWVLKPRESTQIGLPDVIETGVVSRLIQDSSPVFQAAFSSEEEAKKALNAYWRVRVFEQWNGTQWLSVSTPTLPEKQAYQITALQTLAQIPHLAFSEPQILNNNQKHQLTELAFENHRTISLAHSLKEKAAETEGSDQALIQEALQFFSNNDFVYTHSSPQPISNAVIDDFLFEQRQGFCEDYAQAMAVLLRASGIPSRLVAGFYGGHLLNANTIELSNQNAHVWVEAWIDGQWQIIDPTRQLKYTEWTDDAFSNVSNDLKTVIYISLSLLVILMMYIVIVKQKPKEPALILEKEWQKIVQNIYPTPAPPSLTVEQLKTHLKPRADYKKWAELLDEYNQLRYGLAVDNISQIHQWQQKAKRLRRGLAKRQKIE